jgi:hypothetical protein
MPVPFDKKCPNRHELKDKAGPQHPLGVRNTPNALFFDLIGSHTRVGGWVLFCSTRVL